MISNNLWLMIKAFGPRIVGLVTPVLSLRVKIRVILASAAFNKTLVVKAVGIAVIGLAVGAATLTCSIVKSLCPR